MKHNSKISNIIKQASYTHLPVVEYGNKIGNKCDKKNQQIWQTNTA